MKKCLMLLSVLVFCIIFVSGNTLAANPTKIKVGILLRLPGRCRGGSNSERWCFVGSGCDQ